MEMTQGCSPDPAASLPGWEPCTPTLPAHPASSPWEQSCFVHPRGGFEAVDVTLGWQGAATWPCTPHWALALPSIQLKLFLDHCSPRVLHISLILAAGRAEEQSIHLLGPGPGRSHLCVSLCAMSWEHWWHPLPEQPQTGRGEHGVALCPQVPGEIPIENCSWAGSSCLCSPPRVPGFFPALLGWVGEELCPPWCGTGWTICSAAGGAETWLFFAKHTE